MRSGPGLGPGTAYPGRAGDHTLVRDRLTAALNDGVELLRSPAVQYWPERLEGYAQQIYQVARPL
jgi:hypothetical protein